MFEEFVPKSYIALKERYDFSLFKRDLVAGITVGIIALPLAMAFAIASGVGPEKGLYTAIIAGFLISLFGGSRVQIGGPTGAFVVLILSIIQKTGYEGLALSTLIASLILIGLGFLRVGSWIKYVPQSLVIGFTTGIAVIIFSSQLKYFQTGSSFLLGSGAFLLILLIRRLIPAIPWGIAAIVCATTATAVFHLPVETIHSKFGTLPQSLPWPSFPSFSIPEGQGWSIFINAIAIALLGGIESLLSAVIADQMTGRQHKSNCELVGQGIANFASVLFGGIPATGAIARTAANVKTGAVTPIAGMIHAITLFLVLFLLAPLVSAIPLAALAAILVMVSWNMSELKHFIGIARSSKGDALVLFTAFILTVFVDIVAAIGAGMAVHLAVQWTRKMRKTI